MTFLTLNHLAIEVRGTPFRCDSSGGGSVVSSDFTFFVTGQTDWCIRLEEIVEVDQAGLLLRRMKNVQGRPLLD
jgi:hypothetical protein